jgi:hypothetical protein
MRLRPSLAAAAFAAASFFAPAAAAQVPFIPQFGVLGGVNFGSLSDARAAAGEASLENSTGFHVGAFAELGLGPVGLRPAILFVKAGNIEFPGADDFETSYIAVPVDVRYSPLPTPVIKPYLLAGPEVRLPLGEISDLPNSRSIAFGANVGVGAKLGALIGPTFFGEIRYAFDISGFVEDQDLGEGTTVDTSGNFGLNGLFVTVGVGL